MAQRHLHPHTHADGVTHAHEHGHADHDHQHEHVNGRHLPEGEAAPPAPDDASTEPHAEDER
jgi:hydrogenase nickel incorporation protein HypB